MAARAIFDAAVGWSGGRTPEDDATVLVLRCNGVRPRQSLGEKLRALGRFAAIVLASLRGKDSPVPWPDARLENLAGPILPAFNRRWGRQAEELESPDPW